MFQDSQILESWFFHDIYDNTKQLIKEGRKQIFSLWRRGEQQGAKTQTKQCFKKKVSPRAYNVKASRTDERVK